MDILKELENVEYVSGYRAKLTRENMEKHKQLEAKIKKNETNKAIVSTTLLNVSEQLKLVDEYNAKKRDKSMSSIYAAVYTARSIIPETENIKLMLKPGRAWFATEEGLCVNLTEGFGFKAILSLLSRSVILDNTNYLNFMLLDEPLTTVSTEKSAKLSKYLPVLAKNKQIILTEHKEEMFTSTDNCVTYLFSKEHGETVVRRLAANE